MDDLKDCSTDSQLDILPLELQGSTSCPFGMCCLRQGTQQGTSAFQWQRPLFYTTSLRSKRSSGTFESCPSKGDPTSHLPSLQNLPALPGCGCSRVSSREGWKVPPISNVVGISLTISVSAGRGECICPDIMHEVPKENSVNLSASSDAKYTPKKGHRTAVASLTCGSNFQGQ